MSLVSHNKEALSERQRSVDPGLNSSSKQNFPNIISQSHIEPTSYRTKMNSVSNFDSLSTITLENKQSTITTNTSLQKEMTNRKQNPNSFSKDKIKYRNEIFKREKIRIEENFEELDDETDNISHFSNLNASSAARAKIQTLVPINSERGGNHKRFDSDFLKIQKFKKDLEKVMVFSPRETTILQDHQDVNTSARVTILNLNDEENSDCGTDRKTKIESLSRKSLISIDKVLSSTKSRLAKKIQTDLKEKMRQKSLSNYVKEKELTAELINIISPRMRMGTFKHLFKIKTVATTKNK